MEAVTASPRWDAQYEALYREHWKRVVRLCRLLLGDEQEAQDVAQQVFLQLVRMGGARSEREMVWGAWLTRVAVNACRDRQRAGWWRRWRTQHEPIGDVELVDHAPTPEAAAVSVEERARLWQALRELPRRQREVFVLRHLDGGSTQEVAAVLGVSAGSVKRHLFRAIERLRAALGGR